MATLSYPAPVSRGLGGFTESFLQGMTLTRQFREAEERQRRQRLEEPYLLARTAALEREAAAPERLGGLLDVGFGGTLAQPGIAVTEASLAPPPAGPAAPARQRPLGLSRFRDRVGNRAFAELTQAGIIQKLVTMGELVPEDEARRLGDYDRAMTEEFRPNQREAERLIQQGTPEALEQAHLRRSRAWRALAPTLTEADRLTAERNAEEALQKAASVRQDREEGAREARDVQRLAKVAQDVQANPDSVAAVAAVVQVVTGAESKRGRQDNAKLVQKRFETLLKRAEESEPVRDLMNAVQVGLAEHPGDAEKAWDAAFRAKPEAFLKAAGHAIEQGKAPAEPVAKRLFGPDAPKDRMQAAHLVAIKAGPLGSQPYMKTLKEAYADLGAPDDAPKLRGVLTQLRGQEQSTFQTLLLRLDSLRGDPGEFIVRQEIQAAQANIRALDAELRRIGIPLAPSKPTPAPKFTADVEVEAEYDRLRNAGKSPEQAQADLKRRGLLK